MGMDSYLFVAHSKKELQSPDFWKNVSNFEITEELPRNPIGEWWYARKFYSAHEYVQQNLLHGEYECGDFVPMSYEMVNRLLQYCCKHRDYFGGFNTITALCELVDHWGELEARGLKVFYECDW